MSSLDNIFTWLVTPYSGASTHAIAPWLSWHGRLMVLAWGIALPMGVLIARFFKVTPKQDWPDELDNKFWWHAHRSLQYSGVVLMSLGVWLAWQEGKGESLAAQVHAVLGWGLVVLGWMQVAGGLLRGSKGGPFTNQGLPVATASEMRGDHYDMTLYRKRFELLHKSIGYSTLLVSVISINGGLALADAPRWMWAGIWMWWAAWTAAFIYLHRQGYCVDTYQAIWGPSPQHPGNHKDIL